MDGERRVVTIHSHAGKAKGKYSKYFNLKQQSGEFSWMDLTAVDWQSFEDETKVFLTVSSSEVYHARELEIYSWIDNDVFSEVDDEGQKTISVRWIVTEKCKEGKPVVKARLAARGIQEDF